MPASFNDTGDNLLPFIYVFEPLAEANKCELFDLDQASATSSKPESGSTWLGDHNNSYMSLNQAWFRKLSFISP